MTEQDSKVVTIFYAWQSDSPAPTNRNGIRSCLTSAASQVEASHPFIKLEIDEATRGMAGAGNIPAAIFDKIEACQIFLGDVTTIDPSTDKRKTPNPNVVFEAGYAAAHLGWDRMVLLANTELGDLSDLPFDFDRHRISQYKWKDEPGAKKAASAQLESLLVAAIEAILTKDPKKRVDMRGQSPAEVRRQRDLENLIWVLSSFPVSVAKSFADDPPDFITHQAIHFQEELDGVIASPYFHLYDQELNDAVRSLSEAWGEACSYGLRYYDMPNPLVHRFGQPGQRSPAEDQDYDAIIAAKAAMGKALSKVLELVRDKYLEIEIRDLSRKAFASWDKFVEEAGFKDLGVV